MPQLRLSSSLLAVAVLISAPAAAAQTTSVGPPLPASAPAQSEPSLLARRADDVVRLINGEVEPDAVLARSFLDQAPADQVRSLAGRLRERYGRALTVARLEETSVAEGRIHISLERGRLSALLQLEPGPNGKIDGLLFDNPNRSRER